jgi:hypothetical protein
MLPEHAPAEFADRETLWNAVQNVETQKNAQMAREVEVALPNELPRDLQIKYLREFVQTNFVDKGMVADVCIHKAMDTPKRKKKKNDHAHIMLTTRGFKANGEWALKERKDYARDENGNKIPEIDPKTGLQKVRVRPGKGEEKLWKRVTVEVNDWNRKENAETWRQAWADTCNRALAEIQSPERVDHRSYKKQGKDQIPTKHEGFAARQIEARGGTSELCEYNREVREANGLCITYQTELAETEAEIVSVKKMIEAEREKERAQKSTLTPEQKQQVKQYYRDTSDFWPGYRRMQEMVAKELQEIYNSPQNKQAFRDYRRAQWLCKHSHGIVDKGLAIARLLFAKADYQREQERVERVKTKRDELYELCKESLSLSSALKDATKRNDLSDEILAEITEQQDLINKRLEEITREFADDVQAQRLARHSALVFESATVDRKAQDMMDIIHADTLRRRAEAEETARKAADAERRKKAYGNLIRVQSEWIQLAPRSLSEPYTDKYEKTAAALTRAIENVECARAAEISAADALRHAGLFGKKAKREALAKAREDLREALDGLAEYGVPGIQTTDGTVTDVAYDQAIQTAQTLLGQVEYRAERERDKLKKEPLEAKNKRAEAEKRFKESCRAVPAEQREEAIQALREASGNVDLAIKHRLEAFYAEIPIGSAWGAKNPSKSAYDDGQAGDGAGR